MIVSNEKQTDRSTHDYHKPDAWLLHKLAQEYITTNT